MQLSLHSDYALRVLIYLGTHPGELARTRAISEAYGISKNHLVRVLQTLGEHGYVDLVPGRAGGVRLARDAESIRLGEVLRRAEPNLRLVECFDRATNTCPIIQVCGLRAYLSDALESFLGAMNRHTLADLVTAERRGRLASVFVQIARGQAEAPRAGKRQGAGPARKRR